MTTRSLKYSQLSDDEVLELYARGAKGEAKWYLEQEIDLRGIRDQAKVERRDSIRRSATPLTIGKIVFFIILVSIFASRMLGRF